MNKTTSNVTWFFKNWLLRFFMKTGRYCGVDNIRELYKVDEFNLSKKQWKSSELALNSIADAIKRLPNDKKHPYRRLIELRYVEGLPVAKVNEELGISHTTHYNYLRKANEQFAINFIEEQINHGFDKDNLLDLRVYERY